MVNGLYTKKEFKDNENTNGFKKFSDPDFVKTLMTGVTSKAQMIDAIEGYNTDHKLNEKERIKYSVGIASDIYINVIKATKLGGSTYAIVGYDYNGYGNLVKDPDPNKSNKFETAISTHIVDEADIVDVWFGGYNKDHLADVFNNKGVDEISSKQLEVLLSGLKTDLNVLHASGEYRLFFNKFTYVMKKNNLNELSYEHRSAAYNTYAFIWTKYISIINDILANFQEKGYTDLNSSTLMHVPPLVFIEAENDEEIKEKIRKAYRDTGISEDQIEGNTERMFLRTFGPSDIETFKSVVSEE